MGSHGHRCSSISAPFALIFCIFCAVRLQNSHPCQNLRQKNFDPKLKICKGADLGEKCNFRDIAFSPELGPNTLKCVCSDTTNQEMAFKSISQALAVISAHPTHPPPSPWGSLGHPCSSISAQVTLIFCIFCAVRLQNSHPCQNLRQKFFDPKLKIC